jgi:hypothetical protein
MRRGTPGAVFQPHQVLQPLDSNPLRARRLVTRRSSRGAVKPSCSLRPRAGPMTDERVPHILGYVASCRVAKGVRHVGFSCADVDQLR